MAAAAVLGVAVVDRPAGRAAVADPSAAVADTTVQQQLSRAQEQLSQKALGTLAARVCPPVVAGPELKGLPAEPLPCLGAGPARAPRAGDGRPTVVNLWASWCPPCVKELPMLQRAADASGAAVRFVGIDTQDERDSAASLLQATGVRYEQYEDPAARTRTAVGGIGLPITVVYDATGAEVARKLGKIDEVWLADALRRAGGPGSGR